MRVFIRDRFQTVFSHLKNTIQIEELSHMPQANMSSLSQDVELSLSILLLFVAFTMGSNRQLRPNIDSVITDNSIHDIELKQLVYDLNSSDYGDDHLRSNIVAYADRISRRARDDAYFASESNNLVSSIWPPHLLGQPILDDIAGKCNFYPGSTIYYSPCCHYPINCLKRAFVAGYITKLALFKGLHIRLRKLLIIWQLVKIINNLRFKRLRLLKTFTKHLTILIRTRHRIRIRRPIIHLPPKASKG